jgi:hypothetical protein
LEPTGFAPIHPGDAPIHLGSAATPTGNVRDRPGEGPTPIDFAPIHRGEASTHAGEGPTHLGDGRVRNRVSRFASGSRAHPLSHAFPRTCSTEEAACLSCTRARDSRCRPRAMRLVS